MRLDELFLKQPKAQSTKVWQPDEHVGKHKKRWYLGNVKANKVKWPKTTFKGQSQDYEGHILK